MINTRSNGPMGHPTHKSKCYNTLTVQEHVYTHTHARTLYVVVIVVVVS